MPHQVRNQVIVRAFVVVQKLSKNIKKITLEPSLREKGPQIDQLPDASLWVPRDVVEPFVYRGADQRPRHRLRFQAITFPGLFLKSLDENLQTDAAGPLRVHTPAAAQNFTF